MKKSKITREEINEKLDELYNDNFLLITEAGIRLTYPFLRYYMKNPLRALKKVVDHYLSSNSSKDTTTDIYKDIMESICYLLVGSTIRKWVSLPELYQELRKKGYTITTTYDSDSDEEGE